MRIIRGRNKGKILSAPKNLPVRPTTDMAKEGVFNIIENYLNWHSTSAIDLFCGTGNISFEMASRGVKEVISVDNHIKCIQYVNKISKELEYKEIITRLSDVLQFLKRKNQSWDFIFADPPYDFHNYKQLIDLALLRLKEGGVFILEHGSHEDFSDHSNCFDNRKYGSVKISIFSQESN